MHANTSRKQNKKKDANLAENLKKTHYKSSKSIFLPPPAALEAVLLNGLDDGASFGESPSLVKGLPKTVPISFIIHAPSPHVANLNTAKSNTIDRIEAHTFSHEPIVVTAKQNNRINAPHKKESRNFFKLLLRIHAPHFHKIYKRRIGTKPEPRWIQTVNELAVVHVARMLVYAIRFILHFVTISRRAGGTIGVCVGKTCLILKRPQQFQKKFAASSHPVALRQARPYIFSFANNWQRALAGFVCISLIFILPLKALSYYGTIQSAKDEVIEKSKNGFTYMMNAASLAKYAPDLAANEFDRASFSFAEASQELDRINATIRGLLKLHPQTALEIDTGKLLVSSAEHLAKAAGVLSSSGEVFRKNASVMSKISELRNRFSFILPDIVAVNENLARINPEVLNISEEQFSDLRSTLALVAGMFTDFVESGDILLDVLGLKRSQKYLFLFQNNTEIRPTGGFIGSIAEVTVDRGKIVKLFIPPGGPYDLRGALRVRVAPPEPLQLISPFWQFQDANWFPDFAVSANKLAWFYEQSGGPSVDGVIAINASVVQELLRVTGPIDMPEYGKIITADNFILETQKAVELEYDKTVNQPKKFIADLMPQFIAALTGSLDQQYFEIIDILAQNLRSKDVQIALRNPLAEAKVQDLQWDGKIKNLPPETDYLFVVNSNIAGQKSDAVIKQYITHRTEVSSDGTMIDTVVIRRMHNGQKGDLFSGVRNVDFLRVYVPQGSMLLEASGFEAPDTSLFKDIGDALPDSDYARMAGEFSAHTPSGTIINNEFGKTVFGNWMQTDPGEESVAILKYQLPWRFGVDQDGGEDRFTKYSLLVQKQSGIMSDFVGEVQFADAKKTIAFHPNNWQGDGKLFEVKDILAGDKFYSLLLQK